MGKFDLIKKFELPEKPRKIGITEIRGPYYTFEPTPKQLKDFLEVYEEFVDGFKFAGGSQLLVKESMLKKYIKIAHDYNVYVNTGGLIERVLVEEKNKLDLVEKYLDFCKSLEFDVVEVSNGMFENENYFSLEDRIEIVKMINKMGMKAKPEISIISGAGAGTKIIGYEKEISIKSVEEFLNEGRLFLKNGAYMLMIESEGITEGLEPEKWRKDILLKLREEFGIEKFMLEISPEDDEARKTFKWYIKNVDRWVNVLINPKNIVEFNAWRLGIWGDRDIWKNKKVSPIF